MAWGADIAAILVDLAVLILADVLMVGLGIFAIECMRQRRAARPAPHEVEYYAPSAFPLERELAELEAMRRGGVL